MRLFTIGFTQKSAETFFGLLQTNGVKRVIDTRLNNRSQLAGFSKADDLRYFLAAIGGIEYRQMPELAPTQELLDSYKKAKGAWDDYAASFNRLISDRRIDEALDPKEFRDACLLCSEHHPKHCHRRLVAEYLRGKWPNVEIVHLT